MGHDDAGYFYWTPDEPNKAQDTFTVAPGAFVNQITDPLLLTWESELSKLQDTVDLQAKEIVGYKARITELTEEVARLRNTFGIQVVEYPTVWAGVGSTECSEAINVAIKPTASPNKQPMSYSTLRAGPFKFNW